MFSQLLQLFVTFSVTQKENNPNERNTLFVSAFQNEVVIEQNEAVPKYLRYDHCLQKHVFLLSKFDFNSIIEEHQMSDKEVVKNLTWNQLSFKCNKLFNSYFKILFSVYKYGFSADFMRNFCAGLTTKLPACEKKYHFLKKQSAKGKLTPDLTKTSKQTESFAVSHWKFYYFYFI